MRKDPYASMIGKLMQDLGEEPPANDPRAIYPASAPLPLTAVKNIERVTSLPPAAAPAVPFQIPRFVMDDTPRQDPAPTPRKYPYVAKAGSKTAALIEALRSGPVTVIDLAARVGVSRRNVKGFLKNAIESGTVLGKSLNGRVWYLLPEHDDRPLAILATGGLAKQPEPVHPPADTACFVSAASVAGIHALAEEQPNGHVTITITIRDFSDPESAGRAIAEQLRKASSLLYADAQKSPKLTVAKALQIMAGEEEEL